MENIASFNLTCIVVSNLLGILLLLVLLSGNFWRFRDSTAENKALKCAMLFTFINCLMDPLTYAFDGASGTFLRIFLYAGNSWIYFGQIAAAVSWVVFFCYHLNGGVPKFQRGLLIFAQSVAGILLLINLFHPIVFEMTEANVYERRALFFVYAVGNYSLFTDTIILYVKARIRGGNLKFFPLWVYIIPLTAGGTIQSLVYGVSVNSACLAVALAGVLASLQNERIYRDSLTGLYNRAYLDSILKKVVRKRLNMTGIMLDLNGFKAINDTQGHSVGDQALISAAEIFRRGVEDLGIVIRYAGDEFIIMINSQDDIDISTCMSNIRDGFQEFNKNSGASYKLSVSMGFCKLDLDTISVDEFLNEIDSRMYEDKKAYYAKNTQVDRRRS